MRKILIAFVLSVLAGPALAADNYTATAGSGLTFAAKDNGSAVYFPRHIMCDNTTTTQCVAVDASGRITLAPNQSVSLASGQVASGAYASGAFASGAFASGSVAPGAFASGALAAGAGTDGWDATQGAKADAVCGSATGTCSIAALVKYLNTQASTPLNNSSVAINVSTATTTQLVALSGSTVIYVTSYDVIAGGTGNITFVYGTGSNCGTGTTSLTGAYPLTAQAGIAKGSGIGTILKVPAGNALCVTTSAAVQMSGSVSYQQF